MPSADPLADAVHACMADIDRLAAGGVDRPVLDRIGVRLAHLAAQTDLFDWRRFPLPAEGVPTAIYTLHVASDGRLPLQLLCARPMPNAPVRPANKPHQHPTWAAAACIRGCTREQLWQDSGTGLRAGPERTLSPESGAFTMLPAEIHSVRGDDTAPAMHLLLYGYFFPEAVVYDPESGRAAPYAMPDLPPPRL
ncbi:MAG TPA: hypothetical protein VEA40_16740 [Ramlibacter sp.]|nr:hypothetical protein [Ramlibacter sp.]